MSKGFLSGLLFLMIALVFQVFWSFTFGIRNIRPDFILVTLIFICFQRDSIFGVLMGFTAGLLTFATTGFGALGLLFSRLLAGFFAGSLTKSLSKNNDLLIIISVLWLTPVSGAVMMITNPRPLLLGIEKILISTLLNVILAGCILLFKFIFFKDKKNYYLD